MHQSDSFLQESEDNEAMGVGAKAKGKSTIWDQWQAIQLNWGGETVGRWHKEELAYETTARHSGI